MKRIIAILSLAVLAAGCSHMSKPVIGVSSAFVDGRYDQTKEGYVTAVRKAGGVPFILPRVTSEEEAGELLDIIDGILFIGGDDVNPVRYGEEPLNESVIWDDAQDTSDFLLIEGAIARDLPILGICRGCQTINVALGGTLWQDIPAQVESPLAHRQTEPSRQTTQTVRLDPESRFAKIIGAASFDTNSHHHQAVKDVAPGLRACGWAEDGIVEAVEGDNIIAIQSHPENLIGSGDLTLMPLFHDFITRAANGI